MAATSKIKSLLTSPIKWPSKVKAVEIVDPTAEEITLLADNGASVAHCPTSNLKLASGICPLTELVENGVNVGLGTDGAASNNRLDILRELHLASLLAKGSSGRADTIDAHQSLRMATLGGAKALGLEREIGSIEIGKAADFYRQYPVCLFIDDREVGMFACFNDSFN